MKEWIDSLTAGDLIAFTILFALIYYWIARFVAYLGWRYGKRMYEADNDPIDEEEKE